MNDFHQINGFTKHERELASTEMHSLRDERLAFMLITAAIVRFDWM